MTKFSNKLKKLFFWPILGSFSQFWDKKKISQKTGSATHNFIWVSSTMPNFRKKTNDTIPRKRLYRRTEGRKDGQTPFYRTLQATARGPKNYYLRTVERVPYIVSAFFCRALTFHQSVMQVILLKAKTHRARGEIWFEGPCPISLSVGQNNCWLVPESNLE